MEFELGEEFAKKMDKADPLRKYRKAFHFPKHNGKQAVYLCGNSLGLQPKAVKSRVKEELKSWKKNGVEGHFKDTKWVDYHTYPSTLMANIVGGLSKEVVLMNTLTVNLHLLMISFYRPTSARFKVLIEGKAFPSDQYAVKSQIRMRGYDPDESLLEIYPDEYGVISTERIIEVIQENKNTLALVLLGGVNYYTGQVFDLEKIARITKEAGAYIGYDLAHAVGNIPLRLHDWNVDFAVWCTYKYLNSGPGAIAGAFIHEKHLERDDFDRLEGWWGTKRETRFLMKSEFEASGTSESWQLSNIPVLSTAPIIASLELFDEIGMEKLREKSVHLTSYLEFLLDQLNHPNIWITPPAEVRGCQISIHVREHARDLYEKISENGVICDFREPDVIRIAPVPIYNSYSDVYRFCEILKKQL